jgi:hypothetical protein
VREEAVAVSPLGENAWAETSRSERGEEVVGGRPAPGPRVPVLGVHVEVRSSEDRVPPEAGESAEEKKVSPARGALGAAAVVTT